MCDFVNLRTSMTCLWTSRIMRPMHDCVHLRSFLVPLFGDRCNQFKLFLVTHETTSNSSSRTLSHALFNRSGHSFLGRWLSTLLQGDQLLQTAGRDETDRLGQHILGTEPLPLFLCSYSNELGNSLHISAWIVPDVFQHGVLYELLSSDTLALA